MQEKTVYGCKTLLLCFKSFCAIELIPMWTNNVPIIIMKWIETNTRTTKLFSVSVACKHTQAHTHTQCWKGRWNETRFELSSQQWKYPLCSSSLHVNMEQRQFQFAVQCETEFNQVLLLCDFGIAKNETVHAKKRNKPAVSEIGGFCLGLEKWQITNEKLRRLLNGCVNLCHHMFTPHWCKRAHVPCVCTMYTTITMRSIDSVRLSSLSIQILFALLWIRWLLNFDFDAHFNAPKDSKTTKDRNRFNMVLKGKQSKEDKNYYCAEWRIHRHTKRYNAIPAMASIDKTHWVRLCIYIDTYTQYCKHTRTYVVRQPFEERQPHHELQLVCLFVICASWISWSKLFYCFGHRDG